MELTGPSARSAQRCSPLSSSAAMCARSQRRDDPRCRGALGKRCTSSTTGRCSFHCNKETRQLSAPRSIATSRVGALPGMQGDLEELVSTKFASALAQKCFDESSVYRNQVACGAWRFGAGEEEDGLGTGAWIDGLMRECSLGVEAREQIAQLIVGHALFERDAVFFERSDDAVPGEHGRSLDHGCRTDAIDAHQRGLGYGELADEVTERRLTDVVGLAAALGDHGVR